MPGTEFAAARGHTGSRTLGALAGMTTAERVAAQALGGELAVAPLRGVGSVVSSYPVQVVVAATPSDPRVMFEVQGSGSALGFVPVVISGLETHAVAAGHGLWLRPEGAASFTLLHQGTGNEFWQTNWDRASGLYDIVYSASLISRYFVFITSASSKKWVAPRTSIPPATQVDEARSARSNFSPASTSSGCCDTEEPMLREISRDLPAEPIGRDRIPYDVEAQFMPLEGFDKARLSQIAGRSGGGAGWPWSFTSDACDNDNVALQVSVFNA